MTKIKGTVGTETSVPFVETEMVTGERVDLRKPGVERLLGSDETAKESQ
jgi:hypothetical protein